MLCTMPSMHRESSINDPRLKMDAHSCSLGSQRMLDAVMTCRRTSPTSVTTCSALAAAVRRQAAMVSLFHIQSLFILFASVTLRTMCRFAASLIDAVAHIGLEAEHEWTPKPRLFISTCCRLSLPASSPRASA